MNPEGGGPSEGVRKIDSVLLEKGHFTEVVCLDSPESGFSSSYPGVVHFLGPTPGNYGYQKNLLPWLKHNVDNYDAVIVNGLWQYHSYCVWKALKGGKVPYFVFTHGMLDPWFKKNYPLKHLKKWIYWPWAEYRVLRDAKAVIFTCEEEKLRARESFWLYKVNEAVTSYGTSVPQQDAFFLRSAFFDKFPAARHKRLVLFLSRIHEKKGCDLLIEAFSSFVERYPDLHLIMAGPDQTGWARSLKNRAEALGLANHITWTGMLQGDLKWGAFNACEVFCLPSHQENFGIVVAEALACGKPVLISDKVNIWREIEAANAGFVDSDSIEGTTRNIERWLNLTDASYSKMSADSLDCFMSNFHINKAADRLVQILGVDND